MGQSKIKRKRKEIRRAVKENFGEGIEALSKMVRKRPKWMPKSIWMLAYIPLFEKKYRKIISQQLD